MTKKHAEKFVKRMKVPGFQKMFNDRFIREAKLYGTPVNDEKVALECLALLGVDDPAEEVSK